VRPKIYDAHAQQNSALLPLLETGVEAMSRIIKSVSLDDTSSKIADTMPNFSHFVRECLYRHAVTQASECTQPKPERFEPRCNPLSKVPCFVCWPNGKPSKDHVRQWSQDNLTLDWLDMKAREHNKHLIELANMNTVKKTPKSPVTPRGEGVFRRLARALRR
jgi:hypothetical protein